MNFFNRAIKNVTRRWSKSVLLLITFLVIGNFVIIGLGVSQASEDAKIITRQKMRAVVTYSVDYQKVRQYVDSLTDEDEINKFYENYPSVTVRDVQEMFNDERVKTANATQFQQLYQLADSNLDYVHIGNDRENNMTNNNMCYIDEFTGEEICETYNEPVFGVKANFFPDMIEFSDGQFTMVEGRFYNQEEIDSLANVVVVPQAFAEYNNLKVGDHIKVSLADTSGYYFKELQIDSSLTEMDLEIIGIYEHIFKITPDSENFNYLSPYENYDNIMLMPVSTLYSYQVALEQVVFDYYKEIYPDDEYYSNPNYRPSLEKLEDYNLNNVTLLLNDPLEVDKFVAEYENNIPQFLSLDANNEEFNRLARPLDTLSLYANFIVWLVVINAIVIITLVTALTLKTREYEIGVLLSVGASKFKIIAQFFVELAIVAVIGFSLSVVTGSMIANKVGQTVLNYQIESSGINEDDDDEMWVYDVGYNVWSNDYTTDVTLDDFIEGYNVSVSPIIIAEIYIVGLGIVLVSILIPSMMIMRFNPKRILMNQN